MDARFHTDGSSWLTLHRNAEMLSGQSREGLRASEQLERDFNDLANRRRLAIRPKRGFEAPSANGSHGFLVEAKSKAFHDVHVRHVAVRGDSGGQLHDAL